MRAGKFSRSRPPGLRRCRAGCGNRLGIRVLQRKPSPERSNAAAGTDS